MRALLRFAGEEAKHIQLFKRFREEFERGFGHDCDVIGPPEDHPGSARARSARRGVPDPAHRVDDAASLHGQRPGRQALDPQFKSLLKHHWIEERSTPSSTR